MVDGLLYVVKTGCQWRQMPSDFPPWKTVHEQFRMWRDSSVWERVNQAPREQGPQGGWTKHRAYRGDHRFAVGQDGAKRGHRGYDAGKKIKGRKRHIAVDTPRQPAGGDCALGWASRIGWVRGAVFRRLFCPFDSIATVFVDGGYTGKLIDWAKQMFGYKVEVVKRNELHLFRVLPKRWIVERTFAWLNWSRRLSKGLRTTPQLGRDHDLYCLRASSAATSRLVPGQARRAGNRTRYQALLRAAVHGHHAFLPFLHTLPQFVADDPKFRVSHDAPFAFWPRTTDTLVRARYFHKARTVPDHLPHVEIAPQHLPDAGRAPRRIFLSAAWSRGGNAFAISGSSQSS